MLQAHQAEALEAVQTEHKPYFDHIEMHPRMLVGLELPAIGKEGTETIRDEADAVSWQGAVKQLLVNEVKARATKAMEDQSDFLTTVHASIDLFKNNPDLIPGTKGFDLELADRLAATLTPYELRNDDGKLQGYSINTQPLVDKLRNDIVAERAAAASSAASPPAAPAATPPAAAAATPPAGASDSPTDAPQAGIPSKAGAGADDSNDFSALFGTLGLPNLRI